MKNKIKKEVTNCVKKYDWSNIHCYLDNLNEINNEIGDIFFDNTGLTTYELQLDVQDIAYINNEINKHYESNVLEFTINFNNLPYWGMDTIFIVNDSVNYDIHLKADDCDDEIFAQYASTIMNQVDNRNIISIEYKYMKHIKDYNSDFGIYKYHSIAGNEYFASIDILISEDTQ